MMNSKNTRDIKVNLNSKQIEDQIASLLYAYGLVKDNEEILELKIGPQGEGAMCDCREISYKIRKNSEVKTITHNG